MPRALFFPWGWGGGVGYTARGIALAERLRDAGWDAAFADCGVSHLVREAGFPVLAQPTAGQRDLAHRKVPDYLPFGNVERVFAVAARYYREDRFRAQFEADLANVREYGPDLAVVDMTPTAAIAARVAGVPVLSVADTDFLSARDNAWMPWLKIPAERLLPHPPVLPAVNATLASVGLSEVAHPSELLWGDLTVVPSVPELEPPEEGWDLRRLRYVGPLYWDPPWATPADLPAAGDRPAVYVSVGSGAMAGAAVMQHLLDALGELDVVAFVSAGYAGSGELRTPANVHVGGFTGLRPALAWADAVVSHGGYSTVMATLAHGKPSVVVPFMSEQEMNGRELVERPGAGVLVRRSVIDPGTARISYVYRTSGPSADAVVPTADLHDAVRAVLGEPSFTAAARRVAAALAEAERASDLTAIASEVAGWAPSGDRSG